MREAADNTGPWDLQDGEHWQPEWTGNAALLLAAIEVQLSHRAEPERALQWCIDRLEELKGSLELREKKFSDLAQKRGHAFPGKVPRAENGGLDLSWLDLQHGAKGAEKAWCGGTVVQKGVLGESVFFSVPLRFALKTTEILRIN